MTRLADDLAVFRLALLTEDRSRAEQSALQRFAERVESEWNRMTSTNMRRLAEVGPVDLVAEILDADAEPGPRAQAETWAAKVEKTARRRRYRDEGLFEFICTMPNVENTRPL